MIFLRFSQFAESRFISEMSCCGEASNWTWHVLTVSKIRWPPFAQLNREEIEQNIKSIKINYYWHSVPIYLLHFRMYVFLDKHKIGSHQVKQVQWKASFPINACLTASTNQYSLSFQVTALHHKFFDYYGSVWTLPPSILLDARQNGSKNCLVGSFHISVWFVRRSSILHRTPSRHPILYWTWLEESQVDIL